MKDFFRGKTDLGNMAGTLFLSLFLTFLLFFISGILVTSLLGAYLDNQAEVLLMTSIPAIVMLISVLRLRKKYLDRPGGMQAKSLAITGLVIFMMYCGTLGFIAWQFFKWSGDNSRNEMVEGDPELKELIDKLNDGGGGAIDSMEILEMADYVVHKKVEWRKMKSEMGKFEIQFPFFEAEEGSMTQLINGEEIVIYFYKINCEGRQHMNLGYGVYFTFLPGLKADEINDWFDGEREHIISLANAKLEHEILIDSLDCPGREMYFTIDGSNVKATYRIFYKDGILYKLAVITEEGKLFNHAISHFLDSFHISEQ
jgi:hypothetical protein